MAWVVYILKCVDDTLYTGITNDLPARLEKHTNGKGAKYTRSRGPYEVVLTENFETRSDASKRELEIKSLSRDEKIRLISAS